MIKNKNYKWINLIIYIVNILFLAIYVCRLFNVDYWEDEIFSILMSRVGIVKIFRFTAEDVHPPLYYLFVLLAKIITDERVWGYRIVSLIPLGIMLFVSSTYIRKQWGIVSSLLFSAMVTFMNNALIYNVEVRMYSWAALFVVLSFIYCGKLMTSPGKREYILFTIFSVLAAYTHYYALVSVAFFYFGLIIWTIAFNRRELKRLMICCVATFILYLPWFIVLVNTFSRTSGDYWMSYVPTLKGAIRYVFELSVGGVDISKILLLLMLITVIISIIFAIREKNYCECGWIITGCMGIAGTILTGEIVSHVFRPMFVERFIFPVSVVAWLVLSVTLSKHKSESIIATVLMVITIAAGTYNFYNIYTEEQNKEIILANTLESMNVSFDDIIMTNEIGIYHSVLDYYFPGVDRKYIEVGEKIDDTLVNAHSKCWLLIGNDSDLDTVEEIVDGRYMPQVILDEAILGDVRNTLYVIDNM